MPRGGGTLRVLGAGGVKSPARGSTVNHHGDLEEYDGVAVPVHLIDACHSRPIGGRRASQQPGRTAPFLLPVGQIADARKIVFL